MLLAACEPPSDATSDVLPVDGIGYVVLNAPIVRSTSTLLIKDFEKLSAEGAHEIDLGINSPGGVVSAAEAIVAAMDRLHADKGVTFNAYELQFVASAATLVFLDAQKRYALPHSTFVFHAPFVLAAGMFDAETLRKSADVIDRDTQLFRDVLLARTHLTRGEIDVYVSRTVVLSADDAQQDGVIDAVKAMKAPREASYWTVEPQP